MAVLVTGAAGFIGYHTARRLLDRAETVIGLDNLTPYYDVALKRARLAALAHPRFRFLELDLADPPIVLKAIGRDEIDRIVHLAAQPGVRYSIDHPFEYAHANLTGHLTMLELFRHLATPRHLVYASSSSVYGGNRKLPFATSDSADHPVSLYAATKKADELMSHAYAHLYQLPMTGLRFFTVYGPWGRPDMAVYSFTRDIYAGRPITLFNHGDMMRDFTYVDDIVAGVIAALDHPPAPGNDAPPCRLYNIGNNRAEPLPRLIEVLERATGRKANIRYAPMQPGDVKETCADIDDIRHDLGFQPTTPLDIGIPRFVEWFKSFHKDEVGT
ncbi:NAD-dependent epimerase/dehydratase family protein [Desertibaculum subflavum]|uniref:NAD-dependent epimerase/dehydratase family protein n=1 Tax=Desertibaculum subflavum TaxID=2268458 RepID=UPI000E667D9B